MTTLAQTGSSAAQAANSEQLLIWGLLALGIALLLVILEFLVPSGGVIGIGAVLAAGTGIVLLVIYDLNIGLAAALAVLVLTPIIVGVMVKYWPDTPIARLLILKTEIRSDTGDAGQAAYTQHAALLGQRGKAVTDLRPVGICQIQNQRLDCIADSGMIRAGTEVEVVSTEGMEVKVKRI